MHMYVYVGGDGRVWDLMGKGPVTEVAPEGDVPIRSVSVVRPPDESRLKA